MEIMEKQKEKNPLSDTKQEQYWQIENLLDGITTYRRPLEYWL